MLVPLAVCILANTFFVKAEKPQELREMKQASTSMAKSSNVGVICPDPKWSCPGDQTCCSHSESWRCCPYPGGTCCADGLRCCPSGQLCVHSYWCISSDF